jgi:hypothetical protein
MNMSFYELYIWLGKMDFPSISAIWSWLINVPWWMAIGTVIITIFAIRVSWDLICYFLNWLFNWTFAAGERFGRCIRYVDRLFRQVSQRR